MEKPEARRFSKRAFRDIKEYHCEYRFTRITRSKLTNQIVASIHMQIALSLLIHRPRDEHGEIKRRSSEQRRINSGIATGCASTKGRRGEILERRRREETEGSEKLEEESYEFGRDRIASCNINKVLRGFPLDHKGNGIGLFGR